MCVYAERRWEFTGQDVGLLVLLCLGVCVTALGARFAVCQRLERACGTTVGLECAGEASSGGHI